jgi:hypothetical protein
LDYYPERLHTVKEAECSKFNAALMRNIIDSKMAKNLNFLEEKTGESFLLFGQTNLGESGRLLKLDEP